MGGDGEFGFIASEFVYFYYCFGGCVDSVLIMDTRSLEFFIFCLATCLDQVVRGS